MITIEVKSDIILKEVNEAVYTAGKGYKIYKIFGIPFYKKIYDETLLPELKEDNPKENIGFNKKK